MFKQTPKKRVLFVHSLRLALLVFFGVFSLLTFTLHAPKRAEATTASTVNFQARLQTAAGAIVPDGNYNVEFKLYSASSGGTALWTEDYYNNAAHGLTTTNGYLTANLGSITAFSGINWDQPLWLTMNIGGTTTGTPTLDGEMSPRLTLTAVPYAFRAGQLATSNAASTLTSTLSIQAPTVGNQTFVIQDQGAAGTYNLLTAPSGSDGYIKLQGSTPGTAQTGSFNISGTGIAATALQAPSFDAATASSTLTIAGANATTLNIAANALAHTIAIGNGAAVQGITIGSTNSTSSLLVQAGTGNLQIQTQGGTLGIGNNAVAQTLNIGNATGATAVNVVAGTGNLGLGNGGVANTIQIGNTTGAVAQTLNIGNNATASSTSTVVLGSLIGSSATTVQAGTGNINLVTNSASAGTVVQTSTNSTKAFQVQNSSGTAIFLVDTVTTTNLLTNPGFEVNTTGWALSGSATIAQNTTLANAYHGQASLLVTTSATGAGATVSAFTGSITPAQYNFSFYAMSGTNTGALGVTITGGTTPTCTLNSTSLSSSGFQRYNCTFTSTTSNVTAITIKTTGGSNGTFWLDGVQLVTGSVATPYAAEGAIQLRGTINSPTTFQNGANSTSAFQIQNVAGTSNLFVADTLNSRIGIGTNAPAYALDVAGDINSSTALRGPLLDTATGVGLSIGTGTATSVTIGKSGVATNINGALNVASGSTFTNASSTLNTAISITNMSGGGNIGASAAATVDVATTINVAQSTSGQTMTLYSPTVTTAGRVVYVSDTGSVSFKIGSVVISPATTAIFLWNGSAWTSAGIDGTGANYIQNTTSTQAANLNVQAATSGSVGATIQANAAGSGDILDLLNGSGGTVASVGSTGSALFKASTNSTTAFQLQNSTGTALLSADTTNMNINTAVGQLNVGGVANPATPTLTSASTTGTLAAGTYYYQLATQGAAGKFSTGIASSPGSVTTTGSTSKNTLSWTAVSGAAAYIIYRSTDGGATWKSNAVSSGTTSLVDNGTNFTWTTSNTPQNYNTTGGISLQQSTILTLDGGTGNSNAGILYNSLFNTLTVANANSAGIVTLQGDSFQFQDTTGYNSDLVINNTGATTFKNRSNTTSAFRIQNAAGTTTELGVDTVNNQVTVNAGLYTNAGISNSGGITNAGYYSQTGGDFTIGSSTGVFNSLTSVFQIQGAKNPLVLATNQTTTNLITPSPGFENGSTSGWAQENSGFVGLVINGTPYYSAPSTSTAANVYDGRWSEQVTTTSGTANTGIETGGFTGSLSSSTAYTLSFYAKASGSNFSTLRAGMAYNGSTETACTLNSTTVSTSYFTRYSCTFTTGTISGSPYVFMGVSDTTQHVFYLDDVQLTQTSSLTPYDNGSIELTGKLISPTVLQNQSDSTTAFQIQNAAGTSLLNVDTATGTITLGSGGNTVSFTAAGGLVAAGTAQHAKTIVLTPEYAGAVLDAASDSGGAVNCSTANNGTLTSGFNATARQNYYNWTVAGGTAQCYDVVVQVPVPSDWSSWNGAGSMYVYNSAGTDSTSVMVDAYDTTGTHDSGFTASTYSGLSSGTTFSSVSLPSFSGTYTAGGYMTLKVRITSSSAKNVRIGNITLNYNSKY